MSSNEIAGFGCLKVISPQTFCKIPTKHHSIISCSFHMHTLHTRKCHCADWDLDFTVQCDSNKQEFISRLCSSAVYFCTLGISYSWPVLGNIKEYSPNILTQVLSRYHDILTSVFWSQTYQLPKIINWLPWQLNLAIIAWSHLVIIALSLLVDIILQRCTNDLSMEMLLLC